MTDYIRNKVEHAITHVPSILEIVFLPEAASNFTYDDALFFRCQAAQHWPDRLWMIEEVGGYRYMIKSEARKN